jgi:pilus assembly protein Flp/PilA
LRLAAAPAFAFGAQNAIKPLPRRRTASSVAGLARPSIAPVVSAAVYSLPTRRESQPGETGATAIEYDLIAAGISLAIIGVVNGIGTKLNAKFTSIDSAPK